MCIWHEDADSLRRNDNALNIIYFNNIVSSYLSSPRILGIAAAKGQGKTFLIKTKRNRLQGNKDVTDDSSSVTCFPKDVSLVDTLNKSLSINNSLNGLLKEYETWVTMWLFSIAATIVNSTEYSEMFKNSEIEMFSERVYYFLNRAKNSNGVIINKDNVFDKKGKPSIIFNMLLDLDRESLRIVLRETHLLLKLMDRISNGIYFFIDKVDQAFSVNIYKMKKRNNKSQSSNSSYWQYCQYALADAAYNLFSINSHIKVFYTIRLEAVIDSHLLAKNSSRNIESFLIELSYSKTDLKNMFRLYVQNENDQYLNDSKYKESNADMAMFGFDKIPHVYVEGIVESPFDYLYRHSLRRPCDLMLLCKELYLKDLKNIDLRIFRRVVNESSGKVLRRYFSEVEPFITTSHNDFHNLLRTVNTNIFDLNYMKYVCERYNTESGSIIGCSKDCYSCKKAHPFLELHNIGLLGYLRESFANPIPQQCFLPIGESKLQLDEHDLKQSELFFLHPCLCDVARNLRKSCSKEFITNNETIVGDGIEVDINKIHKIQENLSLYESELNNDKVFISSTIYDLEGERNAFRSELVSMNLYPIMSEQFNFEYGYNDVDSHDHCIDEMLKCKQLVYIIGNKYGGIYSGSRYSEYSNQIVKESGGRITNPSISLMEFFIAKSKGISYKIFINKNVIDEKDMERHDIRTEKNNCDVNVFQLVNFINHLHENDERKGNWWLTYKDQKQLVELIRNQKYSSLGNKPKA